MAQRVTRKHNIMRRTSGNRRLSTEEQRQIRLGHARCVVQRIWTLISIVLILVLLGWGGKKAYDKIVASQYFALQNVKIVGNLVVSEKDVLQTAMIRPGMPLLELDPAAIAAKLTMHPWIKDVNVQRKLPDRLVIEISERTPMAVIALEQLFLIDDEGMPFLAASASYLDKLPLITGLERTYMQEQPAETAVLLQSAYQMMTLIRQNPHFEQSDILEIHCSPLSGLEVELGPHPLRLNLGFNNYKEKLSKAALVLNVLDRQAKKARILYLDNDKKTQQVIAQLAN